MKEHIEWKLCGKRKIDLDDKFQGFFFFFFFLLNFFFLFLRCWFTSLSKDSRLTSSHSGAL